MHAAGLIDKDEYEIMVKCLDDRNLTSDMYQEDIAQELIASIPSYYEVMDVVAQRLCSN